MSVDNKEVESGSVKWFCDERGYGFLKCDNLSGDVFAHHSQIVSNDGYKSLRKGQMVNFELVIESQQKKAKDIHVRS